jgi:hypothetical protein
MSENSAPEGPQKPVVPGRKWKTVLIIVFALIAVALTANSTVRWEAKYATTTKPPPAYTGESPLSIAKVQDAYNSNNELVLVITPCKDASLNQTITDITVKAANKIRSLDRIYVGVFILPVNESLAYPTLVLRLFGGGTAAEMPVTIRENITQDVVYDQYLARKFLRNAK